MSSPVSEMLREAYLGNVTSLRSVQTIAGLSNADAARKLLVSPETFRRWRSDRRPDPTAVRLLATEAGYLPWRGWYGWWEVHDGHFFAPGMRTGLTPAQVAAMPFLLSLTRDLRRSSAFRS